MMQLDNGILANYMQCHYAPDACRNYTFIGGGRIENYGDGPGRRIDVFTTRGPFGQPDFSYYLREIPGGHGGADPSIVAAFIDFVKNDKSIPRNSPIAARNSVATGALGTKSIRGENLPQEIPPVDPKLIRYFANGQKKRTVKK